MYFFNSADRSNLGNAKTDGMNKDLGFAGEQYSLLILLFYIPNGLCDLPLNMLTKKYSGKLMLLMMLYWDAIALLQCAAKSFGFFAGVMFYLTLFYTRGELGFRISIFFGSALLAATFSGLIPIDELAERRTLRDLSSVAHSDLNMKECVHSWKNWEMIPWCIIAFTYPAAFSTASNFLLQIVQRLGYSVVKTNLWTVAPNAVGFVVLLTVTYSSDYFRERIFHIMFAPIASPYFACFMLCAGAYIPSCLVQSWNNNNNLSENARAATTGLPVGLGNLGGIVSAATFRQEYAPKYIPTLVGTAACNVVCIVTTAGLGVWMKMENRRRDREQGVRIKTEEVPTQMLGDGEESEM
ncbi:hypothetical protein BU23DRAFT_582411 [Bimuria novae-zelandiae CBS 107.79]|uniref:MFS general substrate transporter n=1 Tax=Bimuria novae-zelandiae CBS 107.79 TaxID=1447943 RepID=A0A6A5UY10_9PLEO|nr:hypothetical protein BU23DRAFT_582411 [Bimuria novae-zelandiae CBS 107.79]